MRPVRDRAPHPTVRLLFPPVLLFHLRQPGQQVRVSLLRQALLQSAVGDVPVGHGLETFLPVLGWVRGVGQ